VANATTLAAADEFLAPNSKTRVAVGVASVPAVEPWAHVVRHAWTSTSAPVHV
jgi:hypothetical protein